MIGSTGIDSVIGIVLVLLERGEFVAVLDRRVLTLGVLDNWPHVFGSSGFGYNY